MFEQLFSMTFHVAALGAVSALGGESEFEEAAPHRCWWEPSTRLIRTTDGQQAVTEGTIYTLAAVQYGDQIFPPGSDPEDEDQGRSPIRIDRVASLETGTYSHTVIHY